MSKQDAGTGRSKAADARGDRGHLDRQYGNIGISAVAAALPYVGKAKNPAHAQAREEDDRRAEYRTRSVLEI